MNSQLDKLVMVGLPHSAVAESFRSLRTNLMRSLEQGARKLLFVSPWSGDGKSMVCANAAAAFAQIGKRVILVDLDLRRATLGHLFESAEGEGLAEVLEKRVPVSSVLRTTQVPNLSFVCGGTFTTSPADLLSGPRMGGVLQELSTMADVVLFDSPPLSLFAEGLIISAMVDGVVLVLNPSRWKGAVELDVKRSLEDAGAKILGIVLNEVGGEDARAYADYGYGYYGYYGYKYGYDYGGYGQGRNGRAHTDKMRE